MSTTDRQSPAKVAADSARIVSLLPVRLNRLSRGIVYGADDNAKEPVTIVPVANATRLLAEIAAARSEPEEEAN